MKLSRFFMVLGLALWGSGFVSGAYAQDGLTAKPWPTAVFSDLDAPGAQGLLGFLKGFWAEKYREKDMDVFLNLKREGKKGVVVTAHDSVVGGVLFYKMTDDRQPTWSALYIQAMAVDPNFRRQGVATALLQTIEAEALGNGVTMVWLVVGNTNAEANLLYEKLGYQCQPHPFEEFKDNKKICMKLIK